MKHHFIYLFLDGVGLAPAAAENPFAPYHPNGNGKMAEPMPYLAARLGSSLLAGVEISRPDLLLRPVDASLGVPGRPQSATGQAALYTGRNAPAFLGRHLTGFANGSLRILLEESSLFKQVKAAGGSVTSANLYTPGYFAALEQRLIRYSVGALLNLTAEVAFRSLEDYERGEALFWDITNRYAGQRDYQPSYLEPLEAGARLARLGEQHDVTLFECYLPDFAGHNMDMAQAHEVLADVDGLIEGILQSMSAETSLVICSDHGNIENLAVKLHTLNPVPLLVFGPAAPLFAEVENIMGLTPVMVEQVKAGK